MKLEDLGIDPETGEHNKGLTRAEVEFLGVLWVDHVGKDNKISAVRLAVRFDCAMNDIEIESDAVSAIIADPKRRKWLEIKKRPIRTLQNHLVISHNIPVLSKQGINGGYWMGEDEDEAAAFYDTFRKRGLTGLMKAARGKKAILVEIVQQLTFEFEDQAVEAGMVRPTGDPAAVEMVDSFLGKMLEDPERFSAGLRMLSKKYGSVLLDKEQVEALKGKMAELSSIMLSIGG